MPRTKTAPTLSEQLAELSTPRPVSYHPDHEELSQTTAARLCDFSYEDEGDADALSHHYYHGRHVGGSRDPLEGDPRYEGRKVSRREMEGAGFDGGSGESDAASGLDDDDVMSGDEVCSDHSEDTSDQSDQDENDDDDDDVPGKSLGFSDQSDDEEVPPAKFPAFSMETLKEDIEKGKAAKHQLRLWERLLETRIRLQKVLLLGNRLPQCEAFAEFQEAGDQQVTMAIEESRVAMRQLLCGLVELQRTLLLGNKDTRSLVGMETTNQDAGIDDDDDEEIPSDSDEDDSGAKNNDQSEREKNETVPMAIPKLHDAKVSPASFESHLATAHQRFKRYQDDVIEKWNTKTRLASGKINSKAFVQVDQSVLEQIKHVLHDRQRLMRRTQLKRSVYSTLGKRRREPLEDQPEATSASDQSNRDAHLKDYDAEIFDDDDFYHQLLRQLIERRINYSEGADPVTMGTQWLQLQRLRSRAKKNVDTKASKGRKIRYTVHPKLVNFMAPREERGMADVSRNDLFSSLFGKALQKDQ